MLICGSIGIMVKTTKALSVIRGTQQGNIKACCRITSNRARGSNRGRALGYMARALVQATIPHSRTEGTTFVRTNGDYRLSIISTTGLPYGSIPRLLLAWFATEAVRTKSREIVLGGSLSGVHGASGHGADRRNDGQHHRLKSQTSRLFKLRSSPAVTPRQSDMP